ncbi:MAG: histidine kinase dimerization/phosphoacceptor domain -containing protein [Parvibaculum sp.]
MLLETVATLQTGNASDCQQTFRRIVAQNGEISSLQLVSPDGVAVCGAPGLAVGSESGADWLPPVLATQKFALRAVNAGQEGEGTGDRNTILVATLPLPGPDQRMSGFLVATISRDALAAAVQEADMPDGSALAITDARGGILAQRTKGTTLDTWLPRSLVADAGPSLMSGTFVQDGRDSVRRTYVIKALPGNIFGLYGQDPEEPAVAARALLYFVIAFPLLVWIAASLIAGGAAERMVIDPLNRVRQAIRRYIAGEDTARVEEDSRAPEEVQAVAVKFNAMADTIQARDEALRAALDHQKALVREVNHRVRNNLQVMNSLLNLQSRRAKTPEQAAIFLDVQRRLNALGTVHSALYKGDDFRAVDLSVLLKDLSQSTERHLSTEWGRPVLTMQCPVPIFALPDAALTLAFLVTELVAAATIRLSPEGHPATQLDFDLAERPEGGAVLTMKVDQPVLHDIMVNRTDDGHINLFRGLIRQLRAHMEVDDKGCFVTVVLPVLM